MLTGSAWRDVGQVLTVWNPYANPHFGVYPLLTINSNFNYYGAGTLNNIVGTNSEGRRLFYYDSFGPVLGASTPGWLAPAENTGGSYTNQAGAYWIILGGRNDNPFYISENATYGGSSQLQYPIVGIDHRYNTNNALPLIFSIPRRIAGVTEFTQANYQHAFAADLINGNVWITNRAGQFKTYRIMGLNTNLGSTVFGGEFYTNAQHNFNGEVVINIPAEFGFSHQMLGLDAATAAGGTRLGIALESGDYPYHVFASGAPFYIKQATSGDTLTASRSGGATNLFVIDNRRIYLTNLVDFRVKSIAGRTNAPMQIGFGNTVVARVETNGFAVLGNSGSSVTNAIAGVGYTNTTSVSRLAYVTMSSVAYTYKDGAGVVVDARTATGTIPFIMRPGWGISAASGLSGTVVDF